VAAAAHEEKINAMRSEMEELDRKHEEKYETAIAEHRARVEAIEQTLSGAHAQHAQTKEEVSNCMETI
jgi:Skp family chaperone for outer membrane proteins